VSAADRNADDRPATRNPRPRARNPLRWVALFVVLAALGAAAILIPLVYNLRLQLTPGQLAEARARWEASGPRDYDLEYLVRTEDGRATENEEYVVRVRDGRVVLVGCNGELLRVSPAAGCVAGPGVRAVPDVSPQDFGVEALFRTMEENLSGDAGRGGRNYAVATFDPHDGHPVHYVHRVRGTRQRQEWTVRLRRVGEGRVRTSKPFVRGGVTGFCL
jgi:hypothetical protein